MKEKGVQRITCSSKADGKEYLKLMEGRGYTGAIHYDAENQKWMVYIAERESGEQIPGGIEELVKLEQEEMEKTHTKSARIKANIARTGRGLAAESKRGGDALMRAAGGKGLDKQFETTRDRIDVMKGMKKAIPVAAASKPGLTYFARIGVVKAPRITDEAVGESMPRISSTAGTPRISDVAATPALKVSLKEPSTSTGIPRESRFGLPSSSPLKDTKIPKSLRFQLHKKGKEEENEEPSSY